MASPNTRAKPRYVDSTVPAQPTDEAVGVYQKLLDYARILFRQKGYAAVSVNDVVNGVGITKPTLYYYFGDKESLYTAVLIDMMQRGQSYITACCQAAQADTTQTLRTTLLALAQGYFEFTPTCMATLMRDAAGHLSAKNLKKVQEAQHLAIYTPFIELLTQAHQAQEITAHDPKTLAILFVSLLDAMAINTLCDEGRPFDYALKAQTLVNGFFDGFAKREVD